jgi:hypothetical protein
MKAERVATNMHQEMLRFNRKYVINIFYFHFNKRKMLPDMPNPDARK